MIPGKIQGQRVKDKRQFLPTTIQLKLKKRKEWDTIKDIRCYNNGCLFIIIFENFYRQRWEFVEGKVWEWKMREERKYPTEIPF